jgi:hypothetical protein
LSESTGSEAVTPEAVTSAVTSPGTPAAISDATSPEAPVSSQARSVNGNREPGMGLVSSADAEAPLEVEVEEIPPSTRTGFQAFLQHANLHNLLQIESLSRTTGVFLVISQGRRGFLHLSNGELIHAEGGALTGEAAAADILSWGDGEFKSCALPLAAVPTIHVSLQALLLRLAKATDEATQYPERQYPERRLVERKTFPGGIVARPLEDDKPTEPHLAAPIVAEPAQRPSAPPPRSTRLPPPLPPRIDREPSSVAEVVLSASGEIIQGRGPAPEEFSARVAYAARLAELIGRAIRSGTPRGLELRGKSTQTLIKWQPDGNLSGSLERVQPGKR